jgi:two-component system sensor histidine kinase KdpD
LTWELAEQEMPQTEDDDSPLFYLGAGPMAAILLGMALVPLRGFTTASNFAFVFVALTIAVAEFGGRWAAVATALCSALSLDFFLTQPYLTLTIAEKHDVMAVLGLTVCGLIAAAFGTQRSRRTAALSAARKHLDLLHAALREGEASEAVESRVTRILRGSRDVLPLAAAVVRDERGRVVAASAPADGQRPVPEPVLDVETLAPAAPPGTVTTYLSAGVPDSGGRIALVAGGRRIGWLDVWGSGLPATADSRRTLADVARFLALLLAACRDDTEQR